MQSNVSTTLSAKPVWEPDPGWIAESNLRSFMDRYGIASYEDLYRRSVEDIEWFWAAVLEDLDIRFFTPYDNVVDLSTGPALPRWCTGGEMNIVASCLDKWQNLPTELALAVRYESERGEVSTLTYGELHREVCRCANALRRLGLGPGDAVGLFMPMTPELVVAFLAVIKIGGVVLPLFSGYGPAALATRLHDAGAKALFTADGFFRRARRIPLKETADEALKVCPTIKHVIVLDHAGMAAVPLRAGRDHRWQDLIAGASDRAETAWVSAEDCLMIIYTSGTTGAPKGAVHTHCGFPVKAAQDMRHAMDLKAGECMYWMTDMGWMMGPWLVFGTLILGATMVVYDGAPDYPSPSRIWQLSEDNRVTHLGLSPVLVRALKQRGAEHVARHDLSGLRAVCSTGSPWDPESWQWCFEHVLGGNKPILNYSGGTEIGGGILCGNFFQPLAPASFSGPVPGMDAVVVDASGNPVTGQVGELAIRKPWIGMTRGFWQDENRYFDTYWSRFDGLWVHGDFAVEDDNGLWYILGRSDDTIKVAGKRLGPAEAEAIVIAHEEVAECAAIGVPDPDKGEALVLFVVLVQGSKPTVALRIELSECVASELGKPLKPQRVLFTTALPKTRNAKVMRRVIRAVYLGDAPGDVSSLEDPRTVDAIRHAS